MISILIISGVFLYEKYKGVPKWLSYALAALVAMLASSGSKESTGDDTLDEVIRGAGYSYDPKQDIFYSNIDAWQRSVGYCRMYDEAAAPLGMIIDCEPIYFDYDGRRWLIELWKGQYDLTTGCEIGVYATNKPDVDITGIFKGPFYECAEDSDLLQMSFNLKKNGKIILKRKEKHWWLTAFKLGEFSEPSELTMNLSITLKDEEMRNAFLEGLKKAGYSEKEFIVNGNTIGLKFDKARTMQPITRTTKTDWIIQKKNKLLCDKYEEITSEYDNFPDKIKAIREQSPEMYMEVLKIGKTKQLFGMYEKIANYLK